MWLYSENETSYSSRETNIQSRRSVSLKQQLDQLSDSLSSHFIWTSWIWIHDVEFDSESFKCEDFWTEWVIFYFTDFILCRSVCISVCSVCIKVYSVCMFSVFSACSVSMFSVHVQCVFSVFSPCSVRVQRACSVCIQCVFSVFSPCSVCVSVCSARVVCIQSVFSVCSVRVQCACSVAVQCVFRTVCRSSGSELMMEFIKASSLSKTPSFSCSCCRRALIWKTANVVRNTLPVFHQSTIRVLLAISITSMMSIRGTKMNILSKLMWCENEVVVFSRDILKKVLFLLYKLIKLNVFDSFS